MKFLKYLLVGIFFGIILIKSEVVSWYRIYEMFHFDSFYMYGIIGSAVVFGLVGVQIIKRSKIKSITGEEINVETKPPGFKNYLIGGTIFGLGWALTGACPGPLFALLGAGYLPILIVIFGALFGTYLYGLFQKKLPH